MNTLVALALATPVWGFALQPPVVAGVSILPDQVAQYESAAELAAETDRRIAEARHAEHVHATAMDWTGGLSVATSVALAVTGTLGVIQFADEYGFNARYSETACANGDAVLNACGDETPWGHAVAAGTSAVLLVSTIVVSTLIDYDTAPLRGGGDWRTYEVTRWLALGLTALQAVGGVLLANAVDFGWADEQEDFETLQAFAAAHLTLGATALAVNVANSILLF